MTELYTPTHICENRGFSYTQNMTTPIIIAPMSETRDGTPKLISNLAYATAIEKAGGVFLGTGRPQTPEALDALIACADGLLLMGGHDICPDLYTETNRHSSNMDRERDEIEIALLKRAIAKRIPILGICRGMQVLNVSQGGSLYQDVVAEMPGAIRHDYHLDADGKDLPRNYCAHDVMITPETLLRDIAKTEKISVNSLHHQGIHRVADVLRPVAIAPDGLIEAIEIQNYPFGLGVEWHPEELEDSVSKNIFVSFIDASRKTRESSSTASLQSTETLAVEPSQLTAENLVA